MADRRRWRRVSALLAVLAVLGSACGGEGEPDHGTAHVQSSGGGGYEGAYLDTPYVVPDITLEDTAGAPYTLATAAAPLTLVFFGYSHCPDICQVVMSTIASAVSRLDADQREQVEVVFVTTDPARDTGPVLRTYLDRLDPAFVGLTGDLDQIVDLAEPMKVFVADGRKLPSGGYEVDHSTHVLAVTDGRAELVWTQGTSPAEMAADIIKLLTS